MTNKQLKEKLNQYPDDAIVLIEFCSIKDMRYDENSNLIYID